jgi:hypothetical protein
MLNSDTENESIKTEQELCHRKAERAKESKKRNVRNERNAAPIRGLSSSVEYYRR